MTRDRTPDGPGSEAPQPPESQVQAEGEASPVAGLSPLEIEDAAVGQSGSSDPHGDVDLHSALLASDSIVCELEQTLVGLVNSTDLFDVPAMDFGDIDTG